MREPPVNVLDVIRGELQGMRAVQDMLRDRLDQAARVGHPAAHDIEVMISRRVAHLENAVRHLELAREVR